MSPRDEDQWSTLSEAVARLVKQQDVLERRMARIEEAVRLPAAPEAEPQPAPGPPEPERPAPAPVSAEAGPDEPVKLPGGELPTRGALETRMGLTWLNRVGVITLVLGAAFFFTYAVQKGWINETARVMMGAGAGFAALCLADRIWRTGQTAYANGITGAGIAILYLSCYAAFGLYHLVPQPAAFAVMVLVTASAGGLALRYRASAIAALGLFGGYATPWLMGLTPTPWFLLGYVLVLDVAAVLLARAAGWRGLPVLAFAGTACIYISQLPFPDKPERRLVDSLFDFAYYGLFVSTNMPRLAIAAQALAALALPVILGKTLFAYAALSLLVACGGLAIAQRRGWAALLLSALLSFWVATLVWYLQFRRLSPPAHSFPLLTTGFLLFLGWLPWRTLKRGEPVRVAELLALAWNAAFYFGISHAALEGAYGDFLGLLAVAMALVHMGTAWLLRARDRRAALLCAGAAWVFLVLAVPLQFNGYRVTMAWAIEAAALAWIGARLPEQRAVFAALGVYGLVILRLAYFESSLFPSAAAYHAVVNLRFLTFAVTAASLWAAARWLRSGRTALAAYLAGHFVLLWALALETFGWAARHAAPENLSSVESSGLSVVIAAYAVALVALGVLYRSTINRLMGLALIALVVVKLYLYDIWLLGLFYRMAAFAILGALLLIMSYLYSRFRISIESWWRERT